MCVCVSIYLYTDTDTDIYRCMLCVGTVGAGVGVSVLFSYLLSLLAIPWRDIYIDIGR